MNRFLFFFSFVLTVKINIWFSSLFILILWFIFIKGFSYKEVFIKNTDTELSDHLQMQKQKGTIALFIKDVIFPLTRGYGLGFILKAYHSPGWEWVKELFSVNPI
jgi:uncharacterized membrane-anchored protein YitT (DUF2179 family)